MNGGDLSECSCKMNAVVVGIMFAAMTGSANAIPCFNCNYTSLFKWYKPFCADPFRETGAGPGDVIECNVCKKEYGRLGNVEGYTRGCYDGTLAECEKDAGCGEVPGSGGQIAGCKHCCDTDYCNGATSLTFNLLATTAMLGVAWTNSN